MKARAPVGRLALHERGLLLLGILSFTAAAWRQPGAYRAYLPVCLVTLAYGAIIFCCRRREGGYAQSIRLASAYLFVLCVYLAVYRLAPAIGLPLRDRDLLLADEALFGIAPALWLRQHSSELLMDFFSAGYLGFHVYVALSIGRAFLERSDASRALHGPVLTSFVIGYAGYLLVPAVGPCRAFPEIFVGLERGGVISEMTAWVVDQGSSVYDVFPSLHVAVTLVLLDHDFRHSRRMFFIMLPVALATLVATVYVGYHYVADAIAGVALFLSVRWLYARGPERAGTRRSV